MIKIACPDCNLSILLYTAAEIAAVLHKTRRNVVRIAARYHLGKRVGREWVFTDDDLDAMRDLPGPGRPKESTDDNLP